MKYNSLKIKKFLQKEGILGREIAVFLDLTPATVSRKIKDGGFTRDEIVSICSQCRNKEEALLTFYPELDIDLGEFMALNSIEALLNETVIKKEETLLYQGEFFSKLTDKNGEVDYAILPWYALPDEIASNKENMDAFLQGETIFIENEEIRIPTEEDYETAKKCQEEKKEAVLFPYEFCANLCKDVLNSDNPEFRKKAICLNIVEKTCKRHNGVMSVVLDLMKNKYGVDLI